MSGNGAWEDDTMGFFLGGGERLRQTEVHRGCAVCVMMVVWIYTPHEPILSVPPVSGTCRD